MSTANMRACAVATLTTVWALGGCPGGIANWEEQDANTDAELMAVWGSSAQDVWAVGSRGTTLHNTGNGWHVVDNPVANQDVTLRAVWGWQSNFVYAVGDKNTVLRWNGTQWSQEELPVTNVNFYDVSGQQDYVVVVGSNATILTSYPNTYEPSEWYALPVPSDCPPEVSRTGDFKSVRLPGALYTHSLVVGSDQGIVSFNGASCSASLFGIPGGNESDYSVTALGACDGNVYVIKNGSRLASWETPLSSSESRAHSSDINGDISGARSMWCQNAAEIWVVGQDEDGPVVYRGSTIAMGREATAVQVNAAFLGGVTLGDAVRPRNPGKRLNGIWGTDDERWSVGNGYILHGKD